MKEIELLQYLRKNTLSEAAIEKFGKTIEDWELIHPLYCEKSDTLSGLVRLITTYAICHDFSSDSMGGFSERYCFDDPTRALEELIAWHKRDFDDQRPSGWVAVRMVSAKTLKESFNKHHGESYAKELLPYAKEGNTLTAAELKYNEKKAIEELGINSREFRSKFAFLLHTGQIDQ